MPKNRYVMPGWEKVAAKMQQTLPLCESDKRLALLELMMRVRTGTLSDRFYAR